MHAVSAARPLAWAGLGSPCDRCSVCRQGEEGRGWFPSLWLLGSAHLCLPRTSLTQGPLRWAAGGGGNWGGGTTSAWRPVQERKVCGSQRGVTWDYPVLGSLLELCILPSLPHRLSDSFLRKVTPDYCTPQKTNGSVPNTRSHSFYLFVSVCVSIERRDEAVSLRM